MKMRYKIIGLVLVAFVVWGFYTVVSSYHTIIVSEPTISGTPIPDVPAEEPDRFDVLILGMRGDDTPDAGSFLTDTMQLVSIDRNTHKTVMVSLPRDLYIDMTGTLAEGGTIEIKGKINEIYVKGAERQQGLTLASQMVSRITGVHVDKAVIFDFKAFAQIVDSLGGIDIYLAQPFSEKTQWGYEFLLPAGNNHLNGDTALYYVRSRFSSSDFDRARRQQQVMVAIKQKATAQGFLSNPSRISGLLSALKGNVRTNLQLWEMDDAISLAKSLKSADLKTSVLTTENFLYETHLPNGEYVLLPKGDSFDQVKEYFKHLL